MKNFFKKWGPVFVLSLALAIILIDATLLNVSIANLIKDLNTDVQSIQWVITSYSLTVAALTITGGRMGDLFGRKKMFVLGAVIFAAGSLIASLSRNVSELIIGWSVVEGVGAALMMPATASLLVSSYPKAKDRAIAFGVWGGVAAASSAIGPLLGGWLTTNYSWRWGFRLNILVGAVFIMGSFFLNEYRDKKVKTELDMIGVVLSSLGLASLVYGIIESSKYGWIKTDKLWDAFGHQINLGGWSVSILAITLGLVLLALFALWERKHEADGHTPLVSLGIFKNRQFTAGMITMGIVALGQAGLIFSIPIFAQSVLGLDAFETGKILLPMSLAALVVAPLGAFLSNRYFSSKLLIQAGLVAFALGYFILQRELNINTGAADFVPGLIVLGIGMGLVMAQISNLTLSAVPNDQAGEASGLNNTFRQVGATLGTAIIGALLLSTLTASFADNIQASQVIPEMMKVPVVEKMDQNSSAIQFGSDALVSSSDASSPISAELSRIKDQAVTDSSQAALRYAGFFALLGLLASTQLPKVAKKAN